MTYFSCFRGKQISFSNKGNKGAGSLTLFFCWTSLRYIFETYSSNLECSPPYSPSILDFQITIASSRSRVIYLLLPPSSWTFLFTVRNHTHVMIQIITVTIKRKALFMVIFMKKLHHFCSGIKCITQIWQNVPSKTYPC